MPWVAEIAEKAECFHVSLDNNTGKVLRPHSQKSKKPVRIATQDAQDQLQRRKTRSPMRSAKPATTNKTLPALQTDKAKKSVKKAMQPNFTTIAGDANGDVMDCYGYKPRRVNLPRDLVKLSDSGIAARLENLEVENTMLKNEINVTNREIKELVDRLQQEDEAIKNAHRQIQNLERKNLKISINNGLLTEQVQRLKKHVFDAHKNENNLKEQTRALTSEITVLRERNQDLERKINIYDEQKNYEKSQENTLQIELRHAQSKIRHLQDEVTMSNNQCKSIEEQWDCYKFRVKNILAAKEKEMLALQQGVNLTEDTKLLVDEIAKLKQEKDLLTELVQDVRDKSEKMRQYLTSIEREYSAAEIMVDEARHKEDETRQYVKSMESKYNAAESMVKSLRDALKDERAARIRLEAYSQSIAKELKTLKDESGQTISRIRSALREKEAQLAQVLENPPVSPSLSTSAINVADYNNRQSCNDQMIEVLSNKLSQRQTKIDSLMADKNTLKMQLNKLEEKYKADVTKAQSISEHPSVTRQSTRSQGNRRHANYTSSTPKTLTKFHTFGKLFRPRSYIRTIISVYVVFLHLWVATVLFTSTPDG